MRTLKKTAVVLFWILLGYVGGAVAGFAVDIFLLPGESLTSAAYGTIDLVGTIIGLILGIRRVRRWPDEQTTRPNLVPNFNYGELPSSDSLASLPTKETIVHFCGQCGVPVSERAKFCVSCGQRLEAMPGSGPASTPSASP